MGQAIVFDLDDTLVSEDPSAVAAFEATASFAATRVDLDARGLARGVRLRARELWQAAPTHLYCLRIGISSSEGLWCRFEGSDPTIRALREWAPAYRRAAWGAALADQDIRDDRLAVELGERFGEERRSRHEVFADVPHTLGLLAASHQLALLTNGAACLQREKLAASGLGDFFDVVVVSGEFGTGKPDAAIFEETLSLLGADAASAVMVGDSVARDIDGATGAGMRGVWINRFGQQRPAGRADLIEITTLDELERALAAR